MQLIQLQRYFSYKTRYYSYRCYNNYSIKSSIIDYPELLRTPYYYFNNNKNIKRSLCSKSNNNTTSKAPSSSLSIRVINYNLLSPNLSTTTQYPSYPKENLDPTTRLVKIMTRINNELLQSTTDKKPVIFCLQEVSREWSCNLMSFFSSKGYHLVTGLYGGAKNGYMGICIAYPNTIFKLQHVDSSRLSDVRHGGWPTAPPQPSQTLEEEKAQPERSSIREKALYIAEHLTYEKVKHFLLRMAPKYINAAVLLDNSKKTPQSKQDENNNNFHEKKEQYQQKYIKNKDHWEISQQRYNILLFLKLHYKPTKQTFCIANYHMPCSYQTPMVMTIHADMAVQRVQQLSKHNKYPFIFAGDFNCLPDSYLYRFITTGKIIKEDNSSNSEDEDGCNYYPTSKHGMEWKSNIQNGGLDSAYALSNHGEPDFTNYAKTNYNDFIGTLDYIFISKSSKKKKDWNVLDVKPTLHRNDVLVKGPYPNEEEPSDHIMLSADLELLR